MPRPKTCYLIVAVLLAATAWVAPGSLLATLSPITGTAERTELAAERTRLKAVRERLARRKALERSLDQRLEQVARRGDALGLQGERSERALQEARDDARALERRMDRLVPRLLSRAETAGARRSQAARALADLAGLSRQVEVDPALKARLLAVSPLMLKRLRAADSSLDALRDARESVIARHGEARREIPLRLAEERRIERERQRLRRQQAAMQERQHELAREVAALEREEVELARRILIAGDARRAQAEPHADEPAWLSGPAPARDAEPTRLKALAARPGLLARGVEGAQAAQPRVVGAVPSSRLRPDPQVVALPAPPKPTALLAKADLQHQGLQTSRSSLARTATLNFDQFESSVALPGSRRPERIEEAPQAPIMPIPGPVVNGFGEGGDALGKRGLTLAAAPGQAVAAPDKGRVVFAGRFKSYGPLLIIEHDPQYHVLLWGLARLEVKVGDVVRTGQVVGVMATGGERAPQLHVELRRNGRPVNPLPWLAASSSKVRG